MRRLHQQPHHRNVIVSGLYLLRRELPTSLSRLQAGADAAPGEPPAIITRKVPGRVYDQDALAQLQSCLDKAWRLAVEREPRLEQDAAVARLERSRLARALLEGAALREWNADELIDFALRARPEHRAAPRRVV
jgi:hypothetical protein